MTSEIVVVMRERDHQVHDGLPAARPRHFKRDNVVGHPRGVLQAEGVGLPATCQRLLQQVKLIDRRQHGVTDHVYRIWSGILGGPILQDANQHIPQARFVVTPWCCMDD